MTTYNSYEKAKIAMPEACIVKYKYDGKYRFTGMPTKEGTTLCDGSEFAEPADHCMTVEQFLKAGHKFVEGDVAIGVSGSLIHVDCSNVHRINSLASEDKMSIKLTDREFVLRAAALEEKPKRVRYKYVKCESFKEVLKCAIDGEVFYSKDGKGEFKFDDSRLLFINHIGADVDISHLAEHCFYRRIETPTEWWGDAVDFAKQCKHVNTAVYLRECDSIDIDGSMTRDEACDFARILLEQGED